MEFFHITDILRLLGLSCPTDGRSSFYVSCPCCDNSPKNRHLNINLKKEVFRCPRCGVSGGMFELYALFTGVSRESARNAIAAELGRLEYTTKTRDKANDPALEKMEYPITDSITRHNTYEALLSKLSLASDHRENLLKRGFVDKEIDRLAYKTTPALGMTTISKQLLSEGHYLAGIPGFFRTETGDWTFVNENRGILIPVRDTEGHIQGLQIRLDHTEKGKFRWISSAERKDGCRAKCWTHLAGKPSNFLIITEGPMKADVIHALTKQSVLAVPGVNALTELKSMLSKLRSQGLTEIKTAFDMDLLINYHVQKGFHELLALLNNMGFRFGTYLWDPKYKGLDDFIWESCLNKQRREGKIQCFDIKSQSELEHISIV